MDKLEERIKASLENPHSEPWFPELTADLAARAWDKLYRDTGLTRDNYSTERVLSRNISAPREIITSLQTCPTGATSSILVETLTPKTLIKYRNQGANFYSPKELLDSTVLWCLADALAIISELPSLMRTVVTLVRCLHVIKPEDADYDVSFSEPHIPFSIFVSVPKKRIANDALRVAEAVVHEAMHVQLTLLQQVVPLTEAVAKKYYSPWRREFRNAEGISHAMYVFTVIDRFLERLELTIPQGGLTANHVQERRREINAQLMDSESFQFSSELTVSGARFVQRLIYSCPPSLRSSRSFSTLPISSSTSLAESLSPDS
jgi:hypothetical protein